MNRSPVVILYDSAGNAVTVELDGSNRRLLTSKEAILYDSNGNAVNVTLDGSTYRLEVSKESVLQDTGGNYITSTQIGSKYRLDVDAIVTPAQGYWVNEIDGNNSTVAQLGSGAAFVGTATDVSGFAAVAITLHSAQDSAVDGMRFEWSTDGTNWDDIYKFSLDASESSTRRFQFPVCAKYFRVNYINGTTTTTELRIQTILQRNNILTSIHRVQDIVHSDRSAQIMKSVIIAQREGLTGSDFYPVAADVQGNLKVTTVGSDIPSEPSDFVLEYCKESGGDHVMLVDGSTTPVNFESGPSAGTIWSLRELLLTFTADDFEFDGMSFGPNSALTNGIAIKAIKDSTPVEVFRIIQNEDFLRVPGRTPLVNNTGPKDVLGAALSFQGLILNGDNSDKIQITINDNLTSVKLKFLTATMFAVKVA